MSTHGCLLVDDVVNRRRMMLHTYTDGQSIPDVVPQAFARLAAHYSWLPTMPPVADGTELSRAMRNCLITERMTYGPSAAALLIAAKPCFLEPVTTGSRSDLPSWSGLDAPFRLRIKGEDWKLYNEGKHCIGFWNAHDEVHQRLMNHLP